ncbi:hypothetical protein BTS2_2998 [Bacillus sp. TS-2]|nr:hypothetical protein BTS2_2998 [Bacillus sp. TS-2]
MKFIRKAIVKHILTESKKEELLTDIQEQLFACQKEKKQLEFQQHKALKELGHKHDEHSIRLKYNKEIKKREERIHTLSFREQQIHKLELGSELKVDQVDLVIERNIGEEWFDEKSQLEIIVKDGILIEYRESRNTHE